MTVVCTCPDRMGDLIYALPLVRALAERAGGPVRLEMADHCRPLVSLLTMQPYLESVRLRRIDPAYAEDSFAAAPWQTEEDEVFHLGIRPRLTGALAFERHLCDSFVGNFERAYGFSLRPDLETPWIETDATGTRGEWLVLHTLGESFTAMAGETTIAHLRQVLAAALSGVPRPVAAVCAEAERGAYAWLPAARELCPSDMLVTARLMAEGALFIGVESGPAALANALMVPRLILSWFGNAYPTGPGGETFSLETRPEDLAGRIEALAAG